MRDTKPTNIFRKQQVKKSKAFPSCRYSWIFQYLVLLEGVWHIQPYSLWFTETHRILPLSCTFRKFWNKFYPVFHICIYSDLLKSLSVLVADRKGEGKRLVFLSSKPSEVFLTQDHLWSFSSASPVWNTNNKPKFNILSSFFHTIF